jgi:hypothetical protein
MQDHSEGEREIEEDPQNDGSNCEPWRVESPNPKEKTTESEGPNILKASRELLI